MTSEFSADAHFKKSTVVVKAYPVPPTRLLALRPKTLPKQTKSLTKRKKLEKEEAAKLEKARLAKEVAKRRIMQVPRARNNNPAS